MTNSISTQGLPTLGALLSLATLSPHEANAHGAVTATGSQGRAHISTPSAAQAVVAFWRQAGSSLWFAKDASFDLRFRNRFASEHEAAACGACDHWLATPDGALALTVLLDQYPHNAFRGTPRMYDTDAKARAAAAAAVAAEHDRSVSSDLSLFFYLPYAHSETLADQDRSVALARRLGEPSLTRAQHHRDIIRRFGRFPHRNAILARASTPEELRYLADGGYAG